MAKRYFHRLPRERQSMLVDSGRSLEYTSDYHRPRWCDKVGALDTCHALRCGSKKVSIDCRECLHKL